MRRAMRPGICVFAWAPPVYTNLPVSSHKSDGASIACAEAAGAPESAGARAAASFPKAAGRCILPPLAENQNGNPGETMVAPAQRLNLLRRQWWTRAAVCAVVLLSAAGACVARAQDRAVAYAPADIR